MNSELPLSTNCLRCGTQCRSGTPDPEALAIVQANKAGYCASCMVTILLTGIEPIRDTINGTSKRGGIGPEIFLDGKWRESVLRPVMAGVLAHTQMPEDAVDWIEVVSNWAIPLHNEQVDPPPKKGGDSTSDVTGG